MRLASVRLNIQLINRKWKFKFFGYNLAIRRGARVAEWGGLENRCGLPGHRGFKSHPLRQKHGSKGANPAARSAKTAGPIKEIFTL